jgi:hypothetical protein
MATGKPQLLFVHGIGGLRDTASDRRRWLEALVDGARDAEKGVVNLSGACPTEDVPGRGGAGCGP